MDSFCQHSQNDDESLLLDDENTIGTGCKKCNNINGDNRTDWMEHGREALLTLTNEPLCLNNDYLDSPEDSPLICTGRSREFGNLSIGDFHCHVNPKHHDDTTALKKLILVSVICSLFMIAELVGGYIAGSLAVMTDAAHLFSDIVGFFISILSMWYGKKRPTYTMTFGYHRAEVLGAFLSVLVIWILAVTFCVLAIGRLLKGEYDIDANAMLIVSSLGLIVNIIMGAILHGVCHTHSHGISAAHSHDENINVRAAAAHILGDILQSAGVLLAAIIVKFAPNTKVLDPICTILFSIIVVCVTAKVAKDSFLILLESSPIDVRDLLVTLRSINGVRHVHSPRLWTLKPGKTVFAVHLAVDDFCDRDVVLNQATHVVHKKLDAVNCFIQIEQFDGMQISNCAQCQQMQC